MIIALLFFTVVQGNTMSLQTILQSNGCASCVVPACDGTGEFQNIQGVGDGSPSRFKCADGQVTSLLLTNDVPVTTLDVSTLDDLTDIEVRDHATVTVVRDTGMSKAYERLLILNNPVLTTVDCPKVSSVVGEVLVSDNAALTSIVLSSVTSAAKVRIASNSALASLDFAALSSVKGSVAIISNAALTSFVMQQLSSAGDVEVLQNKALKSFDLSGLKTIGNLKVVTNVALETFDMSGLTSINSMQVLMNPALTTCVSVKPTGSCLIGGGCIADDTMCGCKPTMSNCDAASPGSVPSPGRSPASPGSAPGGAPSTATDCASTSCPIIIMFAMIACSAISL